MDPAMQHVFFSNFYAILMIAIALVLIRTRQESTAREMKRSADQQAPGSFNFATLSHIRNFLECTVSRKDPNAPVEAGQATNIVLCMALDSLRYGRRLRWNAEARKVEG